MTQYLYETANVPGIEDHVYQAIVDEYEVVIDYWKVEPFYDYHYHYRGIPLKSVWTDLLKKQIKYRLLATFTD